MRLLELKDNGEFGLTKDLIDNIPSYAILSHTWGTDDEEVTFNDLEGAGNSKAGYKKIQFCGEQAARDGIKCFWVDTCCIDKSNSVELQEALNSMFRWYQNAAKCYVYLSDVSINKRKANRKASGFAWESAFRASRWFTRGWTLQELLAPSTVEFFSREGKRLGDKSTLEQQIHEITGIPISAIRGTPLSLFDVDERLLWAERRRTKREEDGAYSLLGIFDIYMPLIYGEGRDNAFARLREEIDKPIRALHHLPYAVDAPFNSYAKQNSPSCLPNTRVDLLREIYGWAEGKDERCIFWLNGLAGTGKSTIAQTVARKYFEQKCLGASFFFVRGGGDVGHAGKFVTSIATQLASSIRGLRRSISDAIMDHSDIANRSLRDQWQLLVLGPLSKLSRPDSNNYSTSYVLVVDALDECDDNNNIRIILRLLAEAGSLEKVRLRIFLTSRPEVPIRHGFNQMSETRHSDFTLHSISPSIVDHDITIFLESSLKLIGEEGGQNAGWPGADVVKTLTQSASGRFIWAATACRFIREGRRFADRRLDTILKGSVSAVTAPEKHLNEIYITVLKHSIPPEYTRYEKEESHRMLRQILGSIAVWFSPLSAHSLGKLLCFTKKDIDQTLEDLHSVLDIPKDQKRPLFLHHPSFRDFLLDKDKCGEFWVDEEQAHRMLADRCIQLMSTSLKQNICGVSSPGRLVTDVKRSRVEKHLPQEIQYTCLYWMQHILKSRTLLHDHDQVHIFLQKHFLHWLEALSLMGKISEAIIAIRSLESYIQASTSPNLYVFIRDARRFTLCHRSIIEYAHLQIYSSALLFSPESSIIRKQFKEELPSWIGRLPKIQLDWSATLQTLEGHTSAVNFVAFSHDGKLLASASLDETVRLWDPATGAALQTLKGHTETVNSVAFSPDDTLLASTSSDKTLRLWDPATGETVQTFEGHTESVSCVAFSPDGKLASASRDKTLRLWDPAKGVSLRTLEGHTTYVTSVEFSHDGKLLSSAASDVRLWDPATGAILRTLELEGHKDGVSAVTFSPDGKLLASASFDKTVRLWDPATGVALRTLEGHTTDVLSVAFCHNGRLLASASFDKTIKLWDPVTGAALQTLEGHISAVDSVAFSHDGNLLASGSSDTTVRLWEPTVWAAGHTLGTHTEDAYSVGQSHRNKPLYRDRPRQLQDSAESVDDEFRRLWDLLTLEGNTMSVRSVAFSHDGKLLASTSFYDDTVKLWDPMTGEVLLTLEGHDDYVYSAAFSHDGKLLASASEDHTVILWDPSTGAALQTHEGHTGPVYSVAFSHDSKLLASGSGDGTVMLWDPITGEALETFEGHEESVHSVAFSNDDKQLASAADDFTVILWDLVTGEALRTLDVDENLYSISFSRDALYLETDRGLLSLYSSRSPSPSPSQEQSLPQIVVEDDWITRDGKNLLCLLSAYKVGCSALHENMLAIGHVSGEVTFIEFRF